MEHSVGPLEVLGGTVTRVEVSGFRDEVPIGSTAYDVEYTTSPGPNGPGCPPEECRAATGSELR